MTAPDREPNELVQAVRELLRRKQEAQTELEQALLLLLARNPRYGRIPVGLLINAIQAGADAIIFGISNNSDVDSNS